MIFTKLFNIKLFYSTKKLLDSTNSFSILQKCRSKACIEIITSIQLYPLHESCSEPLFSSDGHNLCMVYSSEPVFSSDFQSLCTVHYLEPVLRSDLQKPVYDSLFRASVQVRSVDQQYFCSTPGILIEKYNNGWISVSKDLYTGHSTESVFSLSFDVHDKPVYNSLFRSCVQVRSVD